MIFIDHERRAGRGPIGSHASKTMCAVIAASASASLCEREHIVCEIKFLGRDLRQREMAVGGGAAVPRHVLDATGDAAIVHALRARRARAWRRSLGSAEICAIADDLVRAGNRHVEHRREIAVDADGFRSSCAMRRWPSHAASRPCGFVDCP
jgi:hypothetical protein